MKTNLKILVVTYNWPPRNAMGTHRPYAWARHWSDAGAKVTVLTSEKTFFDKPLDLSLPDIPDVEVIEVPYGIGNSSIFRRLLGSSFAINYLKRLKRILQKSISSSVDPRSKWYNHSLPLIRGLARTHDVIISTFGPYSSHLIANAVKLENPKIFWVADYRDLWDQYGDSEASKSKSEMIWAQHKATVGSHANMISAVSQDMVERLSSFCKGDAVLIPNGFDVDEGEIRNFSVSSSINSKKPFTIVHTGTVYRDHRDPTPLIEAIAQLHENGKIDIGEVFVDFYGRAVDPIRDLEKIERFRPFLRIFGHVPREVAVQAQRNAGILLLLESENIESKGILTGKIFEYIAAGRPILCIGSNKEYEIGQILSKTATGKTISRYSKMELFDEISDILIEGKVPSWFYPDVDQIMRFSRKSQSMLFLKEITDRIYKIQE